MPHDGIESLLRRRVLLSMCCERVRSAGDRVDADVCTYVHTRMDVSMVVSMYLIRIGISRCIDDVCCRSLRAPMCN